MKPLIFLLKLERIACWILLLLMLLFILSGYSLTGEYGMNRLIPKDIALKIHLELDLLLIILFLFHACMRIYIALKRICK